MNKPKQIRATVTRTRLVMAAIRLLADEGYAATTMSRVAQLAEVSAGPRQYYFPTPIDLFEAVVDHVSEFQDQLNVDLDQVKDDREYIERRFLTKLGGVGSPGYRALAELRMACRGDKALDEAIGAKLRAFDEHAEASFLRRFGGSGVPDAELRAIRGILVAASSGLSFGRTSADRAEVATLIQKLLPEILADFVRRRGQAGRPGKRAAG